MAENTIITLTSPDGATLNTAGTYCEGDIEVVPKLQEKTATTGEIVTADEGYAGLKSVDTTGVFDAGKQAEYDAFWDTYQQNGERTDYQMSFCGFGWTAKNFKPKYNMKPVNCSYMFSVTGLERANLVDLLYFAGVTLDTSNCTDFSYMFQYNSPTIIPPLDTRSCNNLRFLSNNAGIQNVKIILRDDGSQLMSNPLYYSVALTNLELEGTIGQNGFDVKWSPLNKASIISVINALSSTTTNLTVTLRASAVKKAFETSEGANDGMSSDEWLQLIATKPNWTINTIDS